MKKSLRGTGGGPLDIEPLDEESSMVLASGPEVPSSIPNCFDSEDQLFNSNLPSTSNARHATSSNNSSETAELFELPDIEEDQTPEPEPEPEPEVSVKKR